MSSFFSDLATNATQTVAHAHVTALLSKHPAKQGDKLPLNLLKENDVAKPITLALTGKNVFVGVPGAFTPSCSSQVPAYIEKYDEFKAKGINEIFIISVNDAYVTKAWKEKLAPDGTTIRFLADDKAYFTSAIGLLFDATEGLGGPRSKRYVLITEGETVEKVLVEEHPPDVKVTEASSVLNQL